MGAADTVAFVGQLCSIRLLCSVSIQLPPLSGQYAEASHTNELTSKAETPQLGCVSPFVSGFSPYRPQLEAGSPLPPPSALRRKILIKNKKKHHKQKPVTKQTSDTTFHVPIESGSPPEVYALCSDDKHAWVRGCGARRVRALLSVLYVGVRVVTLPLLGILWYKLS